jgi:hypothetical protein
MLVATIYTSFLPASAGFFLDLIYTPKMEAMFSPKRRDFSELQGSATLATILFLTLTNCGWACTRFSQSFTKIRDSDDTEVSYVVRTY